MPMVVHLALASAGPSAGHGRKEIIDLPGDLLPRRTCQNLCVRKRLKV